MRRKPIEHKKKKCKAIGCDKQTYGTLCNYHKAKKASAKKEAKPKAIKVKKTKKRRSPKISIFKKNAWDVFSLYVRLEDSDEFGMVQCCTCPRRGFFYNDKIDGGHFISRSHLATFLLRHNVSSQCSLCNNWGSGEQFLHGKYLDEKWGKGTADRMEALSRTTVNLRSIDYLEVIKETIPKCELLLKTKKISKEIINKIKDRLEYYKRFVKKEERIEDEN